MTYEEFFKKIHSFTDLDIKTVKDEWGNMIFYVDSISTIAYISATIEYNIWIDGQRMSAIDKRYRKSFYAHMTELAMTPISERGSLSEYIIKRKEMNLYLYSDNTTQEFKLTESYDDVSNKFTLREAESLLNRLGLSKNAWEIKDVKSL